MARPRTILAVVALVLGAGAIAAMIFVLAEPVRAIEDLRDDPGEFSPDEIREMVHGRLDEAAAPLLAASIGGVVALAFALMVRRSGLGAVAILVACLALAGAAYVWARYGEGISTQL